MYKVKPGYKAVFIPYKGSLRLVFVPPSMQHAACSQVEIPTRSVRKRTKSDEQRG